MYLSQLPFKASVLTVAIALTACGGSSSGDSKPNGLANNNVGTSVISAKGGDAQHYGGYGGNVDIYKSYSQAPLNISVNGLPDASYDLPSSEVQLGTNPATITENTTISTDTSSFNADSAGTLYFYNQRLYRYDGAMEGDSPLIGTRSTVITGLQVTAGTTLSLEFTSSYNYLYFFNDIQNDGTILIVADEGSNATPNLALYPAAYYGNGNIDLSGQYPGQDGGDLNLNTTIVQNSGTITTSGAEGDSEGTAGGDAGSIYLSANVYFENSGSIEAKGGSSESAAAGSGENVNIYAVKGFYNTGSIDSSAGTGLNGYTYIDPSYTYIYSSGEIVNSGTISAIGSTSILNEGVTDGGEGGEGGYVSVVVGGGEGGGNLEVPRLINTGSITVDGGNSAFDDYDAGDGGAIYIGASDSYDGGESYVNPILVAISGNLSANGGNTTETTDTGSGNAGDGGYIELAHESQIASNFATQIVGYSQIDVSGGAANVARRGGNIDIYTYSNSNDGYQTAFAPAAPINISTDFNLNAGEVVTNGDVTTTPSGSYGGYLDIYIETGFASLQENLNIDFDGAVSAKGADISNGNTARGGYLWIYAPHDINVKGDMELNGGSDIAILEEGEDDGYNTGAYGGSVYLVSVFGAANLDATIISNGGDGQIEGGEGGSIYVSSAIGGKTKGNIDVSGGNAATTQLNDEDMLGGAGGSIYITSGDNKANISAEYNIAGGAGVEVGFSGGVFLNSDCIDGICGNNYISVP